MWIELDGKRMRLGVPAGLAGLVGMADALTGSLSGSAVGGTAETAGLAGLLVAANRAGGISGGPSGNPSEASGFPDSTARPAGAIVSTITGTVVRWLADDGATVAAGDPVVVVEAMKMETEIAAPVAGTVRRQAKPGDAVRFDDVLGEVVPS